MQIADRAKAISKPIVLEKLDFSKKTAELEVTYKPLARMLSSFACNRIISIVQAAAFRRGIEVIEVNPAYTSVIGAALAIPRRGRASLRNRPSGRP